MMKNPLSASLLLVALAAASLGSNANASHLNLIEHEDRDDKALLLAGSGSGNFTSGLELVQSGSHKGGQGVITMNDETHRSSATLKFIQTTEDPSPFEQPNYWRALLIKSAGAGVYFSVFVANKPEVPVVGFLGLLGYARYGGFSAVCKIAGAGVGGVIGGAIGQALASTLDCESVVAPTFSAGVAVGYGVSTMVLDSVSYGWKRLLGTTKTIKHQTYEIKK